MQWLSLVSNTSFSWLLRVAVLFLVALLIAVLVPFGTGVSPSLLIRFAYWSVLLVNVGASVLLLRWLAVRYWGAWDRWQRLLCEAVGFTLIFPPVTWLVTSLFLRRFLTVSDYLVITGNVLALTVASAVLNWLFASEPASQAPIRPRLFDRLPQVASTAVVRLTVNDHYVAVFFEDGTEQRILMRLTDAIREMEGVPGFCTHRSHWVSQAHITGRLREGQRDYLLLSDGARVPISKTYQPDVAAAGFG